MSHTTTSSHRNSPASSEGTGARAARIPRNVVLRLGWRLLRATDRRRSLSMGLVIVGVAMATLSVLSGVAAVRTIEARADRTVARALLVVWEGEPARAWVQQSRLPYRKRMLLRVDVALAADPLPPPPGLSRWPGAGEAFVSPGFRDAVRHDPALAAYAPATVIGLIEEPGLRSPDELVVYRGVQRADLPRGGQIVVARGTAPPTALDLDRLEITGGQVAGLVGVFAVLVGLPLVAFLSVAARLSASTRARRLAALHLLGVPGRVLRVVNAVEVSVLALLGSALGLLAYPGVNTLLAGSGVLGIVWFPADTALTPALAAAVLVVSAGLAAIAARRADRGSYLTSTRARAAQRRRPSLWRLVPLAVGLTSLSAQAVTGASRQPGQVPYLHLNILMLAAVLTTGVGLLLAASPLTSLAGRFAHRHARTLAGRLGGARAAFDPTGAARLVAGVALLVFALGVAIGQTRDARAVSTPSTPQVDVTVTFDDLPTATVPSLLGSSPAPGVVQVSTPPDSAGQITAILAGCAEVAAYVGRPLEGAFVEGGCRAGTAYWAPDARPDPSRLRSLPLPDQAVSSLRTGAMPPLLHRLLATDVLLTIPDAAAAVLARRPPPPIERAPVDSTAATGDATVEYSDDASLVFRAPRAEVERMLAHIYAHAPYSQPSAMGLDPDSGENIAVINGYIHLGLIGGVLMALLALATALADRATERRRADHELLAGGAPQRLIRRVHLGEVATTVLSSLAVATLAGVLGGLAWQYAGGLVHEPDIGAILALLAFATAAGGLAITVAIVMAPRELDPAVLRSE